MEHRQLSEWIAAYERAWRSPGTDALADLFAEDAIYFTSPYEEAHRGLDAIRDMWEAERSPGEEFTIASEIVAVDGSTGVARVRVDYTNPRLQQYRDIWVITLDERGRCVSYEEWPFWPEGSGGDVAPGA